MTSFANDVRPLFRDQDVKAMKFRFDLSDYDDVKENAGGILDSVAEGSMPCDAPWSADQVAILEKWISEGFPE
ncbi:MAG: hypothetical protein JWM40_1313 [Frankiales bacterium]|nr:hypothetical protein [Frankiales bacterium]